jgi:hypothetical protein
VQPSLPARVALGLLACLALVIAGLLARSANDTPPAPTVAARPPRVAVPVATPTPVAQQRMRSCGAQADERRLAGSNRQIFLQNCVALHPESARVP